VGEARSRGRRISKLALRVQPMSAARFDLFTLGTRMAAARYMAHELSWWGSSEDRIIGLTALDAMDADYLWCIMVRDELGRFRSVETGASFSSQERAEEALLVRIAHLLDHEDLELLGHQGDNNNAPLDLLRLPLDFDVNALHPYFKILLEEPSKAPARAVIDELGRWLVPLDPHLAKEFQTKGFDQRLWEIYLWAAFRELSLDVTQLEAPDFLCAKPGIQFAVEATTVAPSTMGPLAEHPDPDTKEELIEFLEHYMPMKYGSSLMSKLDKKNAQGQHYWEYENVRGMPFLLAIADFHKPAATDELASMTYTQSALWHYLYGRRVTGEIQDSRLLVNTVALEDHQYGMKSVPTGFFDQPNAEHIAAVIFSNAGTIAKFDRMGVAAGFAPGDFQYLRIGTMSDPDPNAVVGQRFLADVRSHDYSECWSEELQVFHNPNAVCPLPFDALWGAVHHYFEDGLLMSSGPSESVLSSYTLVLNSAAERDTIIKRFGEGSSG